MAILDLTNFENAPLEHDPFDFVVAQGVMSPDTIEALNRDYPDIELPANYDPGNLDFGPSFQQLLDELNSAEFDSVIESKFGIDLDGTEKTITVRKYSEKSDHAQWEADKKKAEADKKPVPKEPAKPKQGDKNEPYRKVLSGASTLIAHVDNAAEVQALENALADETVRGEELRLYAWVGADAMRSASRLADLGAVCIVRLGIVDWPGSTDRFSPAVHLRRIGCKVALAPVNETRDGLRSFMFHLARTVRAGLPRDEAFRAAFLHPAQALGLGDEIGTIEKGRRADLVLWTGDPLSATTGVRAVWIDGERIEETP